jgi:hypothetical protein
MGGDHEGMGGRGAGPAAGRMGRSGWVLEIFSAKGVLKFSPVPKDVLRTPVLTMPRRIPALLIKNGAPGAAAGAGRVLIGRWYV